jgi:uncharacterized membrane protein YoaK (UPF0700 family)
MQDIDSKLQIEIQLSMLAFGTGILDATSFPDYSVFASNQTGNTALLAVGALRITDIVPLASVAISLSLFLAGGLVFGQCAIYFGRRKRWWLIVSNLIQTLLVFVAAALRCFTQYQSVGPKAWPIIAILAFSSGGQVALARTIDIPEITTAMVTSAYIDILADENILAPFNRSRNRRAIFIVCLLAGSFLGAVITKLSNAGLAFLLSAIVKMVATTLFIFP